jgi:hypothetical protein
VGSVHVEAMPADGLQDAVWVVSLDSKVAGRGGVRPSESRRGIQVTGAPE